MLISHLELRSGSTNSIKSGEIKASSNGADHLLHHPAAVRPGIQTALWSATNSVTTRAIKIGRFPEQIAITPNGSRVYVANFGSKHRLGDRYRDQPAASRAFKVAHRPTAIAISPDGDRAYVTSMAPGLVSVIDIAAKKPVAKIKVGLFPLALAITPDGSRVYVVEN